MHKISSNKMVQEVRLETNSVEEAIAVVSSSYNPVSIRPLSGVAFGLKAHAVIIKGLGFTIASSDSGVHYDFENPYDGYGLTVPLGGNFAFQMQGRLDVETDGQRGIIVDSSKVNQAMFSPFSAWHRIAISTHDLHQALRELTGLKIRERVVFCSSIKKDLSALRLLRMFSETIFYGMADESPLLSAPAALSSITTATLYHILESLPHNHSNFLQSCATTLAPRQLRRAIDFIHANAHQPIGLKDIAESAAVSSRSIQMAFKQYRNISPMAYLRKVRLQGVHNELLCAPPGTKVAAVAYDWGFAHMGMFAAQYRNYFGENPSTTLKRSE